MTFLVRSLATLTGLALAGVMSLSAATADPIPDREISRELVRRALLDACVYAEAAKEGVKKEKVVDGCQCASTKALKGVKDEEITKIGASKAIPDTYYDATTQAYGTCVR